MSVESVSSITFDGELKDEDFDPVFVLVFLMASAAEDFLDWYEQVAEGVDDASYWLNWYAEGLDDKPADEKLDFTIWMDEIGFDYDKYFHETKTDDGQTRITERDDDYSKTEVTEALAIKVEAINSDAQQANLITTGMIGDYSDGTEELMSMIDTLRSAWRGHIRS